MQQIERKEIRQKNAGVNFELKEGSIKWPVYLKFSWLGKFFCKFGNQVKSTNNKAIMRANLV